MEGESILEPRGLKPSSSERVGSAVWHLDFPSVTLESNSSFASSSTSSESSSSPRSGRTDHSSDPTAASLDCHGKRKVVLPDSEDTELELASELEISRTSHDCNLSALQLTNLPDGLPIQTLVVLRLSDNGLTFLPEDVFCREHCPHLRELDVNSNQLVDIPETLLFLPSLEVLQLNHNYLREIPFPPLDDPEVPVEEILPKLRRVGLDWNQLERFPVEFFLVCADIQDVFLGQNSSMLDDPIPFDLLMDSPAAWAYEDGEVGRRVHVTLDNRPRLVSQVAEEDWAERAPWLVVDFHKIYPDRVLDFLYLGSLRTAQTMSVYHDLDITHLLTVGRNLEVRTEEGMQHLVLPLNDFPEEDLGSCFKEAFDFIDAARHEGSKVLVHCFAGLSRSASIAVAYLMYAEHQCLEEALATVRSARPAAQPNEGFMRCLESYDAKLRNMRQAQSTVVDEEPNDYVI